MSVGLTPATKGCTDANVEDAPPADADRVPDAGSAAEVDRTADADRAADTDAPADVDRTPDANAAPDTARAADAVVRAGATVLSFTARVLAIGCQPTSE